MEMCRQMVKYERAMEHDKATIFNNAIGEIPYVSSPLIRFFVTLNLSGFIEAKACTPRAAKASPARKAASGLPRSAGYLV